MAIRRKRIWAAVLALQLCAACSADKAAVSPAAGPPERGAPVKMTLPALAGGQVSVQSHRGELVLITLFTTWCLRCQAEAAEFVSIHKQYGGSGLRLLGVVMDKQVRANLLQTYVQFVGFTFPVLMANPDDLELVGGLGLTSQVPRTVLLDREGRVVLDQLGRTDFSRLRQAISSRISTPGRSR